MSETSNGMPDLSTGESEPSMEDILASIRKIIADDKTGSQTTNTVSEGVASIDVDDSDDKTSFSDKIDEQQFEIPDVAGDSQDFVESSAATSAITKESTEFEDEDILDLINFAEKEVVEEDDDEDLDLTNFTAFSDEAINLTSDASPNQEGELDTVFETVTDTDETSFDESLDLVMDSDASDYYTQSSESDENRLLREEIENDLNIEVETFEPAMPTALEPESLTLEVDLPEAPISEVWLTSEPEDRPVISSIDDDLADELFSSLDADEPDIQAEALSPDDDLVGSIFSNMNINHPEPALDDTTSELQADAEIVASAPRAEDISGDEEDQDMDLVKSLLADLMDEPETDEFDEDTDVSEDDVFESLSAKTDDPNNILDEILYQSMVDETAISEEMSDDGPQEESELAQIARTARESAASTYQESEQISDEDEVELPKRNLEKRLNLAARGGFVGVSAGNALVGGNTDGASDDLDGQVSQMVDEELELAEIEELLEMFEEKELESSDVGQDYEDADQAALESLVEELESPQEEEKMGIAVSKEALVDEDIEQDSSEAFAALSHIVQEKAELEENGPSIGELVQDALRPMLKEWLDKNLKGIVERAVTKEVKRISAGK